MTLYEADLDKIAVPVKSVQKRKKEPVEKKPRKPKVEKTEAVKKPRAKKQKMDTLSVELDKAIEEVQIPTIEIEAPQEVPQEAPKVEEAVEAPKAEKVKKPRAPRVKKDPTIPPQWFAKYVEGVKKEQASMKTEKTPAKKIREEANDAALKSWNNGLTRNRVQNEVDSHSTILLT